jgi:hypothetical protein
MPIDDKVEDPKEPIISVDRNYDPFEDPECDKMARSYGVVVLRQGWVEMAPGLYLSDINSRDAELHPSAVAWEKEQAQKKEEERIRAKGMDVDPEDLLKLYLKGMK